MKVPKPGRATLTLALLGCAASGQREAKVAPVDFSGEYEATQTDQVAVCSPQPLPTPLSPDSAIIFPRNVTNYEPFLIRVQQDDSRLSATPLDIKQRQPLGGEFTGTIEEDGSFTVTRNFRDVEGQREGGRRFFVEQQFNASGKFQQAAGTARVTFSSNVRYQFREGSHSGPVFTTCTVANSASGTRRP
jgi:hypothetical protein